MTRVNLALLLLVALLALALLLGPDPEQESGPRPLTELDPAALQEIRIDRGPDDSMLFRHAADGWHMTSPFEIAAHQERLQALARIASTPVYRSIPRSEADLAELGLNPASLGLVLDGLTLKIGGTEPIRHRRYILVDRRVHLIDDLFQHHLLADPAALVDPRPFTGTIHHATLNGRTLTGEELRRLQESRAEKVEQATSPMDASRLEVWMEGGQIPLHFRLAGDGMRLWRERLPLLYRLTTPLMSEPEQKTPTPKEAVNDS